MRRFRRALIVGSVVFLGLSFSVGAIAQDDSEPDDPALDAIRATIPDGFPGEYDLTEADEEFKQLVVLYGESTAVADFGSGSELTGTCGGFAYSYGEDGVLIDAAMDVGDNDPPVDLFEGGQAFTSSNPFQVDTRGVVTYFGFFPEEGDGPEDHRWYIKTAGISLDEGGDPNPQLKNRNVGIVDLDEDLPVKFSAIVRVEGEMTTQNIGTCSGEGHVEFIGNGLNDPVGWVALLLLGGGFFGLLFNSRPALTYKG